MTRKDFKRLAEHLGKGCAVIPADVQRALIAFCAESHPKFDAARWEEYLAKCLLDANYPKVPH